MPGWNAHVNEQHDCARDAYRLWRYMGKPRNGDIFTLMKLSRSRLKYALRKCKREQEVIVSDSIAKKMCQKESRNFWKEIQCTVNNTVKLPISVDGVCGDANVEDGHEAEAAKGGDSWFCATALDLLESA